MASNREQCRLVGPFPMDFGEYADCCVACHLSWEEQHALEFLPPEHRDWIQDEHARMREAKRVFGDWPRSYLLQHAAKEDAIFGYFLPPPILHRMEAEHRVLDYKIRNGLPLDD